MIEILLGFVRPDSGRVTINGADITDLVPQALSRLTAWIGQRPVLFAASIRGQHPFARPGGHREGSHRGRQAARVEQFATTAGRIGHQDRRRRLRPFRRPGTACRGRPRLPQERAPVVLDEPTAHLDPATEQEVFDSLRRLAVGRTGSSRAIPRPPMPLVAGDWTCAPAGRVLARCGLRCAATRLASSRPHDAQST